MSAVPRWRFAAKLVWGALWRRRSRLVIAFGAVAIGQAADLVLLDADPLADIANSRRIAGVMVRGQWFDRAALDAMLAGVAARQASR